jgi:class 3 adenylate cyclase
MKTSTQDFAYKRAANNRTPQIESPENRAMNYKEFHYRWEWDMKSTPEQLWPLAADTNRFNLDSHLSPVKRGDNSDLNNARLRLKMKRFGIVPLEWDEEPYEWMRPYRYGVIRNYHAGPMKQLKVFVEFNPKPEGGTKVVYEVWATPANLLGIAAIIGQIAVFSRYQFKKVFERYDQLAQQGKALFELPVEANFPPGGRERMNAHIATLLNQGVRRELLEHLSSHLERADDLSLQRIRPYALADYWKANRREVLEMFLRATRIGLLEFEWDVLCPLCRGPKLMQSSLQGISDTVHCDVCNIDFSANFERSVELTFHPNPAVREIERNDYCVGGPQMTPHIVAQQLLNPGEERLIKPVFEEGRYRIRTLMLKGGQFIRVLQDGKPDLVVRASKNDDWPEDEPTIATHAELLLKNTTREEQLFVVERMAWTDQAVTAAEVTVMQIFRDLFANEALRPGERISVGSLTVLFTDLKGSTGLYREIGDAPAFGLVMDHFDVLRDAIDAENGAIVKTIGDAVMAVFRRPVSALKAILRAQQILAAPPDGSRPLKLKVGIHYGSCIAVNLNERLDYFGTTVNMAARLEGLSSGGDLIISEVVYSDPEVKAWLENTETGLHLEPFESRLKGFDEDSFNLGRVRMLSERETAERMRVQI